MPPTEVEQKQVPLPNRAVIVFDSRYGNTQRIAEALAAGLVQSGIETDCINAKEIMNMESLRDYALVAVGAPTENHTASESIKNFLDKLERLDLSGRYGFTFDTKYDSLIGTGSGAKFIEKKLKNLGLDLISERASAKVVEQKEKAGRVELKDDEEKRFESIGVRLGSTLLASKRGTIPA